MDPEKEEVLPAEGNPGEEMSESNVDEFIEILEQHRKKCEKEGKYVEAEMAKNRVSEIKAQEIQKFKDNLKSKQLSEKLEVEEAHLVEFNQFNQLWDKKMAEFQENAFGLEKNLIEKHDAQMQELRASLEKQLPPKAKMSPELLNLRKIQESLAKQKDYAEAHRVQQRVFELEKQEQMKYEAQREQKIAAKEAQLAQKQNVELQSLKKRIATSIDEQRKTRALELERLLQRYQNIKKELENQQQLERIKKEKQASKVMNSSNAFTLSQFKADSPTRASFNQTARSLKKPSAKDLRKEEAGVSPPSLV